MASSPKRSFLWPILFVLAVAVGGYLAWARFGKPREPAIPKSPT